MLCVGLRWVVLTQGVIFVVSLRRIRRISVCRCGVVGVFSMPCYHPVDAWRGAVAPSSGKCKLIFKRPDGKFKADLQIPCGRCIGCRLEYSRQWAVRCMHEASLYDENCFVTLTYADEHLPHGGTLVKSDLQKFQKRLNKNFMKARFFQCGEYGEKLSRPHYHCCLFGVYFPDRILFERRETGNLYTSEILTKTWGLGHATFGDLTFESAAYVARYVVKKYSGTESDSAVHYTRINEFGEAFQVEPEFCTMSRRPGIGRGWFERFGNEVFPSDEVVVRGTVCKPPRYYDNLQAIAEPSVFNAVRVSRYADAERRMHDGTDERLRSREKCRIARVSALKRRLSSSRD